MKDYVNYSEKYGIDSVSLMKRRQFLHLDEKEQRILLSLLPWARTHAATIAREFYDWQFEFEATRAFFDDIARSKGVSIGDLKEILIKTQAQYLIEVFSGADNGWDVAYFEKRLKVGNIHDRINLPFKWYIGSYAQYTDSLYRHLMSSWRYRWKAGNYIRIISKIFNYDMQAIGDAFLISTLESLGLNVDHLPKEHGRDRTEHVAILKGEVKTLLDQATALATGKLDDEVLKLKVQGTLGDAFAKMLNKISSTIIGVIHAVEALMAAAQSLETVADEMSQVAESTAKEGGSVSKTSDEVSSNIQMVAGASEEMSASIREISENVNAATKIAMTAADMARETNDMVSRLSDGSKEIGKVINVITGIAEQTNLLALNATIEAARAGESGKGFAVVANEVKELARETAKSTEEIKARIETIQTDTSHAVDVIGKITKVIEDINATQTTIASAVEEQTVTTKDVARNIAEASFGSEQIAKSIGSVAKGAQSTQSGAEQTSKSARSLAKLAEDLKSSVSFFHAAG